MNKNSLISGFIGFICLILVIVWIHIYLYEYILKHYGFII